MTTERIEQIAKTMGLTVEQVMAVKDHSETTKVLSGGEIETRDIWSKEELEARKRARREAMA